MTSASELAVSVVMPVYFREVSARDLAFLNRALASVHDQRYPAEYEIVLVDDGSPAPIADLLPYVPEDVRAHIRIVRSRHNGGVPHALNRGLRAARYPLIGRIDHDDKWVAGKIEKQIALFANDPALTIVGTGMRRLDADGAHIDVHIRPAQWPRILRFFVDVGCPFPHGSILARRDVFVTLGGYSHDPRTRFCEDFALWSKWVRFFKAAMIEEALYDHTVWPGSTSSQHAQSQVAASDDIRARFEQLGDGELIPGLIDELAAALRCGLFDAGMIAYRLWQRDLVARVPQSAVKPLRRVLPDCRIDVVDDTPDAVELTQAGETSDLVCIRSVRN